MTFEIKQPKKKNNITYEVPEKHRITYDLYMNGNTYLNFETKKDAELFLEKGKKEREGWNKANFEIKPRKSNPYKLGEMWRDDFDYTGMIKTGAKVDSSWSVEKLQKLFDSYEDVNYHSDSESLYSAIEEKKKGNERKAQEELDKFRETNKRTLKRWGEIA